MVTGAAHAEALGAALSDAFFHCSDADKAAAVEAAPPVAGDGAAAAAAGDGVAAAVAATEPPGALTAAAAAVDGGAAAAPADALARLSTPSSARSARLVALVTRIAGSRSGGPCAAAVARHVVLSLTAAMVSVAEATTFDYAQVVTTNGELLPLVVAVIDAVGGDLAALALPVGSPGGGSAADGGATPPPAGVDYEATPWASCLVTLSVSVFARCVVSNDTAQSVTPAAAAVLSLMGLPLGLPRWSTLSPA